MVNKILAEYKQPWIDALRSGIYKQGQVLLHNSRNNTYCCLGVLCKINNTKFNYTVLRTNFNLDHDEMNKLMGMNDAQNKSFSEIADYIEINF